MEALYEVNDDGTYCNAIKHAMWNAAGVLATHDVVYVKNITDAHEYGRPSGFKTSDQLQHSTMDIFNNSVGRYYGQTLEITGAHAGTSSTLYLYLNIAGAADRGELEIIVQ